MKQLLLYLPVIHSGYEAFLARHPDTGSVLILGDGFRAEFPELAKDIRALSPERAAQYLRLAFPGGQIQVVQPAGLLPAVVGDPLVLPDEEVMRDLAARYHLASGRTVAFEQTFLRWDRAWSQAGRPASFDGQVAMDDLPRGLMAGAQELASRSSDWWRQVGAIAVRGDELLGTAWNRHHPSEYSPYVDGDPRAGFSRGLRTDLSTALHAEAGIVGRAARDGLSLSGADLYVTTFPCPACARLIAEAGFRRCFFAGPYSLLDGEGVLRAAGVEVIWVDVGAEASGAAGGASGAAGGASGAAGEASGAAGTA